MLVTILIVGIIGIGAVTAAVVAFVVIRSRRNPGSSGPVGGTYPQNMGYPPQQPMHPTTQQPYPNAGPGHGYPTAPGQPQQYLNPYTQQPPHQGQ